LGPCHGGAKSHETFDSLYWIVEPRINMVRIIASVRVMVKVMVRFRVMVQVIVRVNFMGMGMEWFVMIPILYTGSLRTESLSWSRSWTWSRIWSLSWAWSWTMSCSWSDSWSESL
jgi:hypothetical protein